MRSLVVVLVFLLATTARPFAAEAPSGGIVIDIPVKLAEARIVFNLDHVVFEGDEPTGLQFLKVMIARFGEDGTKADIVAIFHGAAGYMLLDAAAYDRVRNWQGGNPYKDQILALMRAGVAFEECGETMKAAGWTNADLIPGPGSIPAPISASSNWSRTGSFRSSRSLRRFGRFVGDHQRAAERPHPFAEPVDLGAVVRVEHAANFGLADAEACGKRDPRHAGALESTNERGLRGHGRRSRDRHFAALNAGRLRNGCSLLQTEQQS
jgi:intracellular sulfur oxidation DsrE/DsrF family protein